MASAIRILQKGSVYHIFNRGVEKREIFPAQNDFNRFLATLLYYQQLETTSRFSYVDFKINERSQNQKFKIIAYCLMPNHFHLMLEQNNEMGIERGLSDLQNSYVKYFNKKYDRVGSLFQGRYQSVLVADDEQFIHTARYIMINPYVNFLTSDLNNFMWSSYRDYFIEDKHNTCHKENLLKYFSYDLSLLKQFITDYKEFARTKETFSKLLID